MEYYFYLVLFMLAQQMVYTNCHYLEHTELSPLPDICCLCKGGREYSQSIVNGLVPHMGPIVTQCWGWRIRSIRVLHILIFT